MSAQIPDDILAILDDPYQTITRFEIEHREGAKVRHAANMWTPEQAMLVSDWWDGRNQCLRSSCRETTVVKGRNQGVGLITQEFFAWYVLRCPDPIRVALVAQSEKTRNRHMDRYKDLVRSMPSALHPDADTDNNDEWKWADGKLFHGLTAGGKTGRAQGFTYQMFHMTECGTLEDADATQRLVGSIGATMHRASPHYFKVFESTSEGPIGWWPDHVGRVRSHVAESRHGINFRFFPWSINPSFREPFRSPEEAKAFIGSITEAEARVVKHHAAYMAELARSKPANFRWIQANYPHLVEMQPEALHWRRLKLADEFGNQEVLFAHDYPMTVEEAFKSAGVGWFDLDYLDDRLTKVVDGMATRDGARVWLTHEPMRKYVVAVDIAEGVGGDGDYTVIQVLDNELRQCFVWASNETTPEVAGEYAVQVATAYGNALLLIEANKRGAEAIKAARKLGYKNLYQEKRANGKMDDFVTSGNQFQNKKELLYGHARTQLNRRRVVLNDRLTIEEMMNIGIDSKGSIGGKDKKHDDRAMAWVLAVWAAQRIERTASAEVSRMERIAADFGLQDTLPRRTLPFG